MYLAYKAAPNKMPPTYQTKNGQPITFRVTENVGRLNDGWVLHRIDALVDGQPVGYLKVSYIPRENFDRYFPTVWDYKRMIGGWSSSRSKHDDPTPLTDLTETYLMVARYINMHLFNEYERGVRPSDKEMRAFLRGAERRYQGEYRDFEAFHVDKPLVDYIDVGDEWKGQGIGTALYKYGARWLAKTKGLPLYASGIQTDAAKGAWKSMRQPAKRIPIKEEPHPMDEAKSRTRIDYRRVATAWLSRTRS